jgi:hypothetical protein
MRDLSGGCLRLCQVYVKKKPLYTSYTISITNCYLQCYSCKLQYTQGVCKPTLCTADYALSLQSLGHNDNVVTWRSQVWRPPSLSNLNFLCRPILRTLLSPWFWTISTWSLRNFMTKKNQKRGQFWKPDANGEQTCVRLVKLPWVWITSICKGSNFKTQASAANSHTGLS